MVVLGKHEQPFRGPRSSPPYPPPPQLAAISKAKKIPKTKQNKSNLDKKNKCWCVVVGLGIQGPPCGGIWVAGLHLPHGCVTAESRHPVTPRGA